ncbi:MAG: hypothetical protein ACP6IY_01330 [Promethearchaeia archaeon]
MRNALIYLIDILNAINKIQEFIKVYPKYHVFASIAGKNALRKL